MMKLYHGPTSVCSQKVRLTLAEIGLDYEGTELNLQRGDQFDPDYMRLNPEAVVPTLVDAGLVLVESSLIAEYLDKTYNKGRLMPQTLALEARTRLWLLRSLTAHAAINSMSFATAMRDRVLKTKSAEEIEEMVLRILDPVHRDKRRDLYEHGLASVYVTQALRHLRRIFDDMQEQLAADTWLSGPKFGLADIALAPYVDRLDRLGMDGLWSGSHPRIGDWLAALKDRPSYAVAFDAFIPEDMAASQRQAGAAHAPELRVYWQSILAQ